MRSVAKLTKSTKRTHGPLKFLDPETSVVFLALTCVAASVTIAAVERQNSDRDPVALFHAFLWDSPLPPGALDKLTPEATTAIASGLTLRHSYRPLLVPPAFPPGIENAVAWKRSQLESFIVAVLGDVKVSREASAYASTAAMAYEWEGFSDGPMAEATYAEAFLNRNPTSAIAPALQLFILHRSRCAFEAATFEKAADVQMKASASYRRTWALLQKSTNAIAVAVAGQIDSAPYAYADWTLHPRKFKPPR